MSKKPKNRLVSELEQFVEAGKAINCDFALDSDGLTQEEEEVARLINLAIYHYRIATEQASEALMHRDMLLDAMNHAIALLLDSDVESFQDSLYQSMSIIAKSVDVDRMYIWKNHFVNGKLFCTQLYEWSEGAQPQQDNEYTVDVQYDEVMTGLEELLSSGACLNGMVKDMLPEHQAHLAAQGIVSIIIVPVFIKDEFWGFVGFDDCHSERIFTMEEEAILRSGSLLFSNALLRNEMILDIRDTSLKLEVALEHATAASKAKGDFLSNMSHEMRTPMNAIIGMTTLGKRAEDLEQKNLALSKIGDAASHLLSVINDVLDMSKIEADKLELSPIEYNFEKMLQNVATVISFRVDEKHQNFTVDIDGEVPHFIVGDDQRLAQVITNLLSNAVKFTPEGGSIHLGVSVLNETDGICKLCIEVADSGIGIAPKHHESLFKAFEQAESGITREFGGTGLGLVISRRIVELMGGRIWVESELGQGARFIFTVDVRRSDKSPRSLLAPDVNWENVRILVVDDIAETRNQFKAIFGHLNIKCDVAPDGFEACRLMEEQGAYDIYFVDLRMPGMDGIELTRRIKSSMEDRPSVVTMITAADWQQVKADATAAGVDKHLLKPLFSSMLIDCVNECLGIPDVDWNQEASNGAFEGKKLLVAEDIEINREILIALLENTGLEIDCAADGKEALDIIEAFPGKYDIVFMDLQMPRMDGLEAARRIRALPGHKQDRLPIIAMTANVFKEDIEACLAAGMDDHLGKPLDIDLVIEKLRKYLKSA